MNFARAPGRLQQALYDQVVIMEPGVGDHAARNSQPVWNTQLLTAASFFFCIFFSVVRKYLVNKNTDFDHK